MTCRRISLFIALIQPCLSAADESPEQYEQVAGLCIEAAQPDVCMRSYGFECHQSRLFDRSLEAYIVGCNLQVANGRMHFAQLLYDDGGWSVDQQHTYEPEMVEIRSPAEDTDLALSKFVSEEMQDFSDHSSGGSGSEQVSRVIFFETGTNRVGDRIAVRAVCAVALDGQLDEMLLEGTRAECERLLTRTMQKVAQPQSLEPYAVAGPSEIEWTNKTVTVESGDTALVFDGHYTFPDAIKPCQWISDCCSTDGHMYLDSCRVPSDTELVAVKSCLALGLRLRSGEYASCMRESGVNYGCDEQADGSRICY